MSRNDKILAGLRVLDFTSMVSGPFCTRLLADCGAEVVKVEPAQGDLLRHTPPRISGESRYFAAFNCGKRSVVLDLKAEADVALARRLAGAADVVVENARPGVMDRLGLGADRLCAENPRLVYCSISGFGQTGPMRDWPAYAPIVHALSGFDRTFMRYQTGAERPAVCGIQIADILAGSFAFGAIQTALYKRERTGDGDRIDLSLLDSILTTITGDLQAAQAPDPIRLPSYPPIRAQDDFVSIALISPRAFETLADLIDPAMKHDARFSSIASRSTHMEALLERVEQWTLERSAEECERTLMQIGVPCARYRTLDSLLEDPHLAERQTFAPMCDEAGEYAINGAPFRFAGSRVGIESGAPRLGADRDWAIGAWLGSSAD